MALGNYASLRLAIANTLQRGDLLAQIPDMITLAEARINTDIDARLMDTTATISVSASTETATLPTDLINLRSLVITSSSPKVTLQYMTPDTLKEAYPSTHTSRPVNYTIVGGTLYLAPIPDAAYTITAYYKARFASLSDSVTTNTLLTTYPNVYFYGALCEASTYLVGDNRVPVWETKYAEAIKKVNLSDWYSGSTMSVRSDAISP